MTGGLKKGVDVKAGSTVVWIHDCKIRLEDIPQRTFGVFQKNFTGGQYSNLLQIKFVTKINISGFLTEFEEKIDLEPQRFISSYARIEWQTKKYT